MSEYQALIDFFSNHLNKYKESISKKTPQELYEPGSYILSFGGKRFRPLLALIACDLFDKEPQLALNSALAIELFHNFSLIHDDILDAAPLRRNMPSVHIKWNTNIAILSGDLMLVKASQILENYDFKEFKKLSTIYNKTAIEVCEGQQLDMNYETSQNISIKDYMHMITNKTAVLLGCSLKMGAINANASEENQTYIYEFGKYIGIAYQLLDDLLDIFSDDPEKFGKQIGGDILSGKKTFLLLKAFELADQKQKSELDRLLLLKQNDFKNKITGILKIYKDLNIQKICQDEANKHTQTAINYLEKINTNTIKKNNLKKFAIKLLSRQF